MSKAKRVRKIHQPAEPDPPPRSVRFRWLVPRTLAGAEAHAAIVGAGRTMCTAYLTDGAVYPPAPSVPRCRACVAVAPKEGLVSDG